MTAAPAAPGAMNGIPWVKVSGNIALGAIGVAGAVTGHNGANLNVIVGAILTNSALGSWLLWKQLTGSRNAFAPGG